MAIFASAHRAGRLYLERVAWSSVAVALLSAALLLRGGQIVMRLRTPNPPKAEVAAYAAPSPMPEPARVSDLQRIVAAHLFGSSAAEVDAEAQPAPAQWVLSGVMAGAKPREGWAILGQAAESTHLRFVGQDVASGYRLAEVFVDHVVVEGRGERLTLRLPRTRAGFGLVAGADRADGGVGRLPALAPALWHPPKGVNTVPSPAQAILHPQPHRDAEGQTDGMQVMGIESWVSALGLHQSDVILAVDSQPITSAVSMQQALQQLSSGRTVMVTVSRGGQAMQLPVTIVEPGG